MNILRNETRKARLNHHCEGCSQIDEHGGEVEGDPRPKCKGISKGDKHQYQFNTNHYGDAWSWRSCLPCFNYIIKHYLYQES